MSEGNRQLANHGKSTDRGKKGIVGVGLFAFLAVGCCAAAPLLVSGVIALSLGQLLGIGTITTGAVAAVWLLIAAIRARRRPCDQPSEMVDKQFEPDV